MKCAHTMAVKGRDGKVHCGDCGRELVKTGPNWKLGRLATRPKPPAQPSPVAAPRSKIIDGLTEVVAHSRGEDTGAREFRVPVAASEQGEVEACSANTGIRDEAIDAARGFLSPKEPSDGR